MIIVLSLFIALTLTLTSNPRESKAGQSLEEQGSLTLGKTEVRKIAGGTIHVWNLTLGAGTYAYVEIVQKGIDIAIRVVGPDGQSRGEFDGLTGSWGTDKVNWIANTKGAWKLQIVAGEAARTGDYEIQWTISRQAMERDRLTAESAGLENLAHRNLSQGKYAQAEPLYLQSLEIRQRVFGPDHADIAESLYHLGFVHVGQGKYTEAEADLNRSLVIGEKTLGGDHPYIAEILDTTGGLYFLQQNYAQAELYYKRSLAIREKAGPDHPAVAATLDLLAGLYKELGRYAEAQPFAERSLAIGEKVLGSEDPGVAGSLDLLARVCEDQAKYSLAEPYYKRSLAIREKTLRLDDPDLATSYNNLASLYQKQGKFADAEPLYKRSLAILEAAFGSDNPAVATLLNNLADLYKAQGRYTEAEPLNKRSLVIRQKALGSEHAMVAQSFNNIALLYMLEGNYADAEPLYKRSLSICEKALGSNHPAMGTILTNLARLHVSQRKYGEAEANFKRSLAIQEKALGADHPDIARTLNRLAVLYTVDTRYTEAERHFKLSISISEKAAGMDHPDVAESLNSLADLYIRQGKYTEADPLLRRSLLIREKAFGADHPEVAATLKNLALLTVGSPNKHEPALSLIDRAVRILDRSRAYPEVRIETYALRAEIQKQAGNLGTAIADLAEALRSAEELRLQIGGGEETRAAFFQKFANHFESMVAWQLEAGQIEKAFEYAERGRARVLLDQLAAGKIDLRSSIPADIRAALEKRENGVKALLAEYQQRITLMRSRKDLSDDERAKQINELEGKLQGIQKEYQQLYEEIKNTSPLWRDLITSGGQPVSIATVQRNLVPTNGMLVLYQIGEKQSYVFVIPPSGQKPEALPLKISDETAQELKVEVGALKSSTLKKMLTGESEDFSRIGLQQLGKFPRRAHALWLSLVPESLWLKVAQCNAIVIVPDGELHLLPFEALIVKQPTTAQELRYWLDEGPAIIYSPSATSLYNIQRRPDLGFITLTDQPSILSLSDPIYDPQKVVVALQKSVGDPISRTSTSQEDKPKVAEAAPSRTRDDYERAGGVLIALPGTAREAEEIRKAGESGMTGRVSELKQLDANEEKLRTSLAGKRYVHLATHGLSSEGSANLFSALALTPPATETSTTDNDGFLQLYEIYDLKLAQCDLAVLSACQTNTGKNVKGEGVFALSRGFLAAGARRVVASQWSVDDESTARLMGAFYRRIIGEEKAGKRIDYALALRDSKRAIRNEKQWTDPYHWAPFILIGKQ